ncbi:hypothetical protein [Lentimicrobium sp. S6]|uniref:hypothetical protein n=1 Tax=Lentimicrobium sp. S6 TaxID=2735872 RepID=UPI001557F4DD|nr:hypothetical protein [Lentimicrobium sp. S6]NPD48143.1 hypothetical protein [Lentimicrobium sp. S6]
MFNGLVISVIWRTDCKSALAGSSDPIQVRLEEAMENGEQWITLMPGETHTGPTDGLMAHGRIIKVSNLSDMHVTVVDQVYPNVGGFEYNRNDMYLNVTGNYLSGLWRSFRNLNISSTKTFYSPSNPPEGW